MASGKAGAIGPCSLTRHMVSHAVGLHGGGCVRHGRWLVASCDTLVASLRYVEGFVVWAMWLNGRHPIAMVVAGDRKQGQWT